MLTIPGLVLASAIGLAFAVNPKPTTESLPVSGKVMVGADSSKRLALPDTKTVDVFNSTPFALEFIYEGEKAFPEMDDMVFKTFKVGIDGYDWKRAEASENPEKHYFEFQATDSLAFVSVAQLRNNPDHLSTLEDLGELADGHKDDDLVMIERSHVEMNGETMKFLSIRILKVDNTSKQLIEVDMMQTQTE